MPSTVKVKVNTVAHTTQTSKAGAELNYCEITGFDAAAGKGFKKRFFATKKDGTATKNAELADSLNTDDWVEFTLDDSSYQNVQTLKRISEPEGMSAPAQGGGQTGNTPPAADSSPSTPPAKAGKTFRSTGQLNREKALDSAVTYNTSVGGGSVSGVIAVAKSFESYLLGTDMEVDGEKRGNNQMTMLSAEDGQKKLDAEKAAREGVNSNPQDDDIPF